MRAPLFPVLCTKQLAYDWSKTDNNAWQFSKDAIDTYRDTTEIDALNQIGRQIKK